MMLFNRKKIAAIICTTLLLAAGVVNYIQYDKAKPATLDLPEANEKYDENMLYGEAKYVDNASLSKEKSRSEAIAILKSIAESDNSAADKKAEAQAELIRMAKDMEKETVAAEVLTKKGFTNVSVFLNSPAATVSVRSDGLSPAEIAQIRDTMKNDGNILPQNLKIIELK